MKKGQSTMEVLIIIAVSLIALAIIYSLYSEQVELSNSAKESTTASGTIRRMVDAANSLYISGAGSKTRVFIEIPQSLQMDGSNINGPALILKLSNGTDLVGTADVNFNGGWKQLYGDYVMGGYYATLEYDGNRVNIYYDDFQLSTQSLGYSGLSGSTLTGSFSVRNVSNEDARFWITNSFSHAPNASIVLADGTDSFTLEPLEAKRIDFNIVLSNSSSGNYSGTIDVTGQISDGVSDSNVTKQIVVSAEALMQIKKLMVYPDSSSFEAQAGTTHTASYSICNTSASDISGITWGLNSNADANMASWISWPPKDSLGGAITGIASASCKNFDLNVVVPAGAAQKTFDANFTVFWDSIPLFTSSIYAAVTAESDTTPPVTSIITGCPSGWNFLSQTVSLECSDSGWGCRDTNYQVDGGVWIDGNSISVATDGNHVIAYKSSDLAGNVESVKTTYCAVQTGLMAKYSFENDLNDSSGHDYNGAIDPSDTALTYVAGIDGNAVEFPAGAGMSMSNSTIGNLGDFTFMTWVKTTSISFTLFTDSTFSNYFYYDATIGPSNEFIDVTLNSNLSEWSPSPFVINDGNWHQVAFTRQDGNLSLYFDCVHASSKSGNSAPLEIQEPGSLVWTISPLVYDSSVSLDEYYIFNKALTQPQIEAVGGC